MATISYTVRSLDGNARIVTWANMANGDDGQPWVDPHFSDSCVHVFGTFGVGGTCVVEGTIEDETGFQGAAAPSNWGTLADPQGNALNIMVNKTIEQILENPYQTRPRISAGDGSTDITVKILFFGTAPRWRAKE